MKSYLLLIVCILFQLASTPQSLAASVVLLEAKPKQVVKVEVADTPSKAAQGLMFRDKLTEGEGMWFVFSKDEDQVFWMKNVKFPLDIVFINSKFLIKKIHRSLPPCPSEPCARYYSEASVRYVLEVPGGYCDTKGVKEGQKVEYLP